MFITGMLATAIAWNRRMLEEALYRLKTDRADAAPARRLARVAVDDGDSVGSDDGEDSADARIKHAA
jgi:hypothetical protein